MAWCDQLAKLEAYLKNQPHPMQIVYVPENIGLTDQGELRVFLCGDASYMRWDFSDRETFRRILIGEKGAGEGFSGVGRGPQREVPEMGVGYGGGATSLHGRRLRSSEVFAEAGGKTGSSRAGPLVKWKRIRSLNRRPSRAPETSTEAAPPTQEDIDRSQAAAEEFIFSLDQDKYQRILKKKNRSMTVLPEMQAERIDIRPGKITWDIEAEVFHSDGNMEGETYRTTFRVITAKENGVWQVKDAEVTEEEKL